MSTELQRRQIEAIKYQKWLAEERNTDARTRFVNPGESWATNMAVEMLLRVQCMKTEYQAAGTNVVGYFCQQNGLCLEDLEGIARQMVADEPNKPTPDTP